MKSKIKLEKVVTVKKQDASKNIVNVIIPIKNAVHYVIVKIAWIQQNSLQKSVWLISVLINSNHKNQLIWKIWKIIVIINLLRKTKKELEFHIFKNTDFPV